MHNVEGAAEGARYSLLKKMTILCSLLMVLLLPAAAAECVAVAEQPLPHLCLDNVIFRSVFCYLRMFYARTCLLLIRLGV